MPSEAPEDSTLASSQLNAEFEELSHDEGDDGNRPRKKKQTKKERDAFIISQFDDKDRFLINHFVLPPKVKVDKDLPSISNPQGVTGRTVMETRFAPTLGPRINWLIPTPEEVDIFAIQREIDEARKKRAADERKSKEGSKRTKRTKEMGST
ncbi:hypothetical protein B0T20DRAFT_490591 [Sordaria brevicollis]|uniref:Uncharacterized protein n=1 Tax=Sordaria brevicollis TaxID=83679 RepID=A0AAE0NVZ7_SORBR|nr:hypothetical protein B0T20DRAFT_490591 [Sordaria brevicollis]